MTIILILAIATSSYQIYKFCNLTNWIEKKKTYGKLFYPAIIFLIIGDLLMIWDLIYTCTNN
jgi:hypothetical protein